MARRSSTASEERAPAPRTPTAAQLAAALRYLARETKREAEVATLLGDEASA